MKLIEMENVSKEFKIYKRDKGLYNNIKSLFIRKYEIKNAVSNISISIDKGETIGYIGPNGAGKSTTIKILSGILVPTKGNVVVENLIPHKNRIKNAMNIGVVFGQRSQLNWDLPTEDTFELYKKMYKVNNIIYKRNLNFFIELLDMKSFIKKPVRQLSLGQKMRAEIAIALLHDPKILYLDEPTIGLDVVIKNRIRVFIKELNREKKTTVILTTHDMNDIDQICNRVIMIDDGSVVCDKSLDEFKRVYSNNNYYVLVEIDSKIDLNTNPKIKLIKKESTNKFMYSFNKKEISLKEILLYFSNNFNITNITIKQPEIEEIVRNLYER